MRKITEFIKEIRMCNFTMIFFAFLSREFKGEICFLEISDSGTKILERPNVIAWYRHKVIDESICILSTLRHDRPEKL